MFFSHFITEILMLEFLYWNRKLWYRRVKRYLEWEINEQAKWGWGGWGGWGGGGGELRVPNKHWQGGSVVVRKNKKITSKGRRLFGSQKYFLSVYKVGRSDKEVLEMVSLIPCYHVIREWSSKKIQIEKKIFFPKIYITVKKTNVSQIHLVQIFLRY